MLTKFIFLLSLLALAASMATENESANLRSMDLETIQDVNLYLLNAGLELEPLNGNERLSERQLNQMEAIKGKLDFVRHEMVSMDGRELLEMASVCEDYRALLAGKTDARPLVAFLDSLARANCDQVSLDFLMIVANFKQHGRPADGETIDHLLVQNYAKLRVQQCWMSFVDSVASNLDRTLGKIGAPLFGFVDKLAAEMQSEVKKLAPKRTSHAIQINENPQNEKLINFSDVSSSIDLEEPVETRAVIVSLKDIKLDTAAQRRNLVEGLRKLQRRYRLSLSEEDRIKSLAGKLDGFYDELFLQPCKELVERVRSVVAPGDIFKGHISRTLGRTLAEEKERNPRLDYQLQVYRICKLISQHNAEIERLL